MNRSAAHSSAGTAGRKALGCRAVTDEAGQLRAVVV